MGLHEEVYKNKFKDWSARRRLRKAHHLSIMVAQSYFLRPYLKHILVKTIWERELAERILWLADCHSALCTFSKVHYPFKDAGVSYFQREKLLLSILSANFHRPAKNKILNSSSPTSRCVARHPSRNFHERPCAVGRPETQN